MQYYPFSLLERTATFINRDGGRVVIKCRGYECWLSDIPVSQYDEKNSCYKQTMLTSYFGLQHIDSKVEELLKRGYTHAFSQGFNNGLFLTEFLREFDYALTSFV